MAGKSRTPRGRNFSLVVNPDHAKPWQAAVGKLMINFGGLEFLSHRWLHELARDPALTRVGAELNFGKRVDLIVGLVEREKLPEALSERFKSSWKEAKKLSELRNTIAHNPVVWGWHGKPNGPPHFIGVPNIKAAARKNTSVTPLKELDELNRTVDRLVEIVLLLDKDLEELRTAKR